MENMPIQTNPLAAPPIPANPSSNVADVERYTHAVLQPTMEETDSPVDDTESLDSNSSNKKDISPRSGVPKTSSRNITVQTLMQEGVLEPGQGVLTIDYLGQKFCGDLLQNGKIFWDNTQFASPSSWATFIKKRLNPSKKSGSGWNSVKYKGKKLDKLKSSWVQKNNQALASAVNEETSNHSSDHKTTFERHTIKAGDLKNISLADPNVQIEYEHYTDVKPQPFSVITSSTVMAVVDLHCHIAVNEAVGYLGGKWDPNRKCLYVLQAFPCRCKYNDQDVASAMEQEISNGMMMKGLARVGWYHSHVSSPSLPTLRDIDVQFEMQVINNNHPTVALICDPYFSCDKSRMDSICNMFWVLTNRDSPHEPQVPMKLTFGEVPEPNLSQDVFIELKHLVNYYMAKNEIVSLNKTWKGTKTYMEKIQLSLQKKVPSSNAGMQMRQFIHGLLSSAATSTTTT